MGPEAENQQQRDIGKLWTAIKEIKVALIGIDGNNGLRGEFREWAERTERQLTEQDTIMGERIQWEAEMEQKLRTYLDKTRAETCIGKAALEEYVTEMEHKMEARKAERRSSDETMVAMEKIRLTMESANRKSRNTMIAMIAVALIGLAGTVYSKEKPNDKTGTVQQSNNRPVGNSRP